MIVSEKLTEPIFDLQSDVILTHILTHSNDYKHNIVFTVKVFGF